MVSDWQLNAELGHNARILNENRVVPAGLECNFVALNFNVCLALVRALKLEECVPEI